MKILLLALIAPLSSFACDTTNPQLQVSAVFTPPLPQPPGRPAPRPIPPDGSSARPFRTLKDAIAFAQRRDFCQIRLRLSQGTFEGNVAVDRSTEILGVDRTKSLIQGGVFSTNGLLKLWDLGFVNATIRAIRQTNGEINLNRVSVSGYHFVPNLVAGRPAAVELTNSKGTVAGLDVRGGDQPALLVTGAGSRVKVFGAGIENNHTSPHSDQALDLVTFSGAVEIAGGALVNLMVSNVKNNQYIGIFVRDQASLLAVSSTVQGTSASTGFTSKVGPDGLILSNGSVVELKNSTLQSNARAGVLSLNSWLTMRGTAVRANRYGYVNRNNTTEGKDNYDSLKCANLDGSTISQNQTDYDAGSNMPVPNQPVPIPCPPGETCPAPPPPPPLSCKSVPLL